MSEESREAADTDTTCALQSGISIVVIRKVGPQNGKFPVWQEKLNKDLLLGNYRCVTGSGRGCACACHA